MPKSEAQKKKRKIKTLGYEEWRKREIEKLVMRSGMSVENKIVFLKEVRDGHTNQG